MSDLCAAAQELVSDIGYKVQAVLVEEDEEEEENVEGKDDRKNDTQSRTEPGPEETLTVEEVVKNDIRDETQTQTEPEETSEEKLKDEVEQEQQGVQEITAKTDDNEETEDELKEAEEEERDEEERVEITFYPATLDEPVQLVREENKVMDAEEMHDQSQQNQGPVEQNEEVLAATGNLSQC